jgi:hypothetical protein
VDLPEASISKNIYNCKMVPFHKIAEEEISGVSLKILALINLWRYKDIKPNTHKRKNKACQILMKRKERKT